VVLIGLADNGYAGPNAEPGRIRHRQAQFPAIALAQRWPGKEAKKSDKNRATGMPADVHSQMILELDAQIELFAA